MKGTRSECSDQRKESNERNYEVSALIRKKTNNGTRHQSSNQKEIEGKELEANVLIRNKSNERN